MIDFAIEFFIFAFIIMIAWDLFLEDVFKRIVEIIKAKKRKEKIK